MALNQHKMHFSKVRIARELLREKSEQILQQYLTVVEKAQEAGDYETAAKALQWLMDHMPADDDGGRLVDVSVDKKQQAVERGPTGPAIQVGIVVGGVGQKSLPIDKPSDIKVEIVDAD
jgi:cytochrome c-type biogenesis protein CcmH/NrfG